ncbi:hypothetical protein V8G54_016630 [Vigna mungo]|uniref:Uncharacterized protein n=1 Tax=Vigna mungo TaxID=3915 RepID=A0AAQ3NNC9_VIGMU
MLSTTQPSPFQTHTIITILNLPILLLPCLSPLLLHPLPQNRHLLIGPIEHNLINVSILLVTNQTRRGLNLPQSPGTQNMPTAFQREKPIFSIEFQPRNGALKLCPIIRSRNRTKLNIDHVFQSLDVPEFFRKLLPQQSFHQRFLVEYIPQFVDHAGLPQGLV